MSIIVHTHDGTRLALEAHPGETLARTIFMSRLWHGVPLCSGLGKCGLCRVRYVADAPASNTDEERKLGPDRIREGWRLACLHPSEPCEIEIPKPVRTQRAVRMLTPTAGDFQLAVDLGTTSLHWSVLSDGVPVATGNELNPQTGMGSEVMSRLATASTAEGRFVLRALITDRLTDLALMAQRNMGGNCTALAVSGNSAMTYILLGKKPDDLATAPYTLSYTGGEEKRLGAGLPPAYIAPLLAPFVGADLSAGIVAVEFDKTPAYPYLLADLGTNGEFILSLSPEKRLCASVPMGPALEGVGLSFGRTAGPGAVTGFSLTPGGLVMDIMDGESGQPTGMTGTGYISLVAILLRHGILDQNGQFGQGTTPLAARLAQNIGTINDEPVFHIDDTLFLPASDIEEILKVKAAFNLAITALLDAAGIGNARLETLYLAGALGEHVKLADLETLGFLPSGMREKTVKAGNTCLAGTELLVHDAQARELAESIPASITQVDLTGDPSFSEQYVARMCFTYVD